MPFNTRSLAALPLAAALVIAACGKDDSRDSSRTTPARLALSAREYKLDAGGVRTLPAGLVTVSLRNAGRQDHGLQIYRLKHGLTFERFMRAYRTGDERVLPLLTFHGGTMNVPAGKRWTMTIALRPGTYVLEDGGETPNREQNGRDHGMVTTVRVTGATEKAPSPPAAAAKVALAERGCRVPRTLPRHGTLAISTQGSAIHELALTRVAPGTAARQLRTLNNGDNGTYPDGEPVDLLSLIGGGQTAYVQADLKPGTYVGMCFAVRSPSEAPDIHGRTAVVR